MGTSTRQTSRSCDESLEGILADYRARESDFPPPPGAEALESPFPEDVFRAWREALGTRRTPDVFD